MAVPRSRFVDPVVLPDALPEGAASATLPSRLQDLLESAIIAGQLRPGERLHADGLAARYGVSRIPVREALRSLHEAGWVEIRPRHGVRVREHSAVELDELFAFRAVVENQVARWAASRRTEGQLAQLRDVIALLGRRRTRTNDLVDHTSAFYAVLREAAHNTVIASTSEALEKRARFYFSTVAGEMRGDWLDLHAALVELIELRKPAAAGKLAAAHIIATGSAVRKLLFERRAAAG